jgi:aminomethyltransferase
MSESGSSGPLRRTPLFDACAARGGKMIDFGGWELPVQFSGILEEHAAVRERAGLFDVSHMGEVIVKGPDALALLQKSTCNDVAKLADGRIHYTGLLYPTGGFVDDILIYREAADSYFVVVNAANTDKDFAWFVEQAKGMDVAVVNESANWAQLALQGPAAQAILQPLTDVQLADMKYYRFARGKVDGVPAIVSRTGYTGEDGFEVYVQPDAAAGIHDRILDTGKERGVVPVGLGARDTLRLEAKMALYGNDIDADHTPLQAGLGWIVKLDKGDFNGRDVLLKESKDGVPRILVGFEMIDRGIARHEYPIVAGGETIGVVTSGTHSPSLKKAIGLAYLPPRSAAAGTEFAVMIRGKETKARVVPTPFYKRAK